MKNHLPQHCWVWVVTIAVSLFITRDCHAGRKPSNCVEENFTGVFSDLWQASMSENVKFVDGVNLTLVKYMKKLSKDDFKLKLFSDARSIDKVISQQPLYSSFKELINSLNPRVGIKEDTARLKPLISSFLDEVLKTKTFATLKQILSQENLLPRNESFKSFIYGIWFEPYKRKRSGDSSPFEHVFAGDVFSRNASYYNLHGYHSWIKYAIDERSGQVKYQGFNKRDTKCENLVTLGIFNDANQLVKPVTSLLIGASPAFEMAIYTYTFMKHAARARGFIDLHCDIQVRCMENFRFSLRRTTTCYIK